MESEKDSSLDSLPTTYNGRIVLNPWLRIFSRF